MNTLFDSELVQSCRRFQKQDAAGALSGFLQGLVHRPGLFPTTLGAIRLLLPDARQQTAECANAFVVEAAHAGHDHAQLALAENFLYESGFSIKRMVFSNGDLQLLANAQASTLVLLKPGKEELAFARLHNFLWSSAAFIIDGTDAGIAELQTNQDADSIMASLEVFGNRPGWAPLAYLLTEFRSALHLYGMPELVQHAFPREYTFLQMHFGNPQLALNHVESIFCRPATPAFVHALFTVCMGRLPHHLELMYSLEAIHSGRLNRYDLMEELFRSEASRNYLEALRSGQQLVRPAAVVIQPDAKNFPLQEIRLAISAQPLVSIVIPVYGKLAYTLQCLTSLSRWQPSVAYEVIVVDDCSPDNSAQVLSEIPGLRLLRNSGNLGFIKSCNAGAQQASGAFLFFLNNDTELQENSIDALVKTFNDFPDCGVAGSKLMYPDGCLQEAGGIVWKDGNACNYGRHDSPHKPAYNYVRDVDYVSGASLLIRRNVFLQLGGFDERYCPAYYEDTDLAFQVRALGLRVIYQPASVVVHHEGVSNGSSTLSGVKSFQLVNKTRFFEKWQAWLEQHHQPSSAPLDQVKDRHPGAARQILVIDHYLPQPDRDAGSRSMMHIMETFVEMGFLVKFWPHNNHYDQPYAAWLERLGVEVIAGDHTVGKFAEWLARNRQHIQTVFLSRPRVADDLLPTIQANCAAKIIYYGHDIHHLRMSQQLEFSASEQLRREMEEFRTIEHSLWEKLEVFYYPSVEEEAYISHWWKQRNLAGKTARTIPVYAYSHFPKAPPRKQRDAGKLLFVAGFNHAPNQDAAQFLVGEVLPLVLQEFPNCVLYLVGSNPTDTVQKLHSSHVVVTGSVSEEELQQHYATSMVMIAPLLYGGGMKGKVIESMRNQLPVVTTPVGAQGLHDAQNCLAVAADAASLAERICGLLESEEKWNMQVANALAYVQSNFSRQTLKRVIQQDLQ